MADRLMRSGYAQANKVDRDNAIADCTEVIRLNPSYRRANKSRAISFEKAGPSSDFCA